MEHDNVFAAKGSNEPESIRPKLKAIHGPDKGMPMTQGQDGEGAGRCRIGRWTNSWSKMEDEGESVREVSLWDESGSRRA